MAEKEIKINFEEVKLEALEFFLEQGNSSVETKLKESLDKMYEKYVPSQVRKFVERNVNEQPGAQENNTTVQESPAPQQRRRRGRSAVRENVPTNERSDVPNEENAAEQHAEEGQETAMEMVM